MRAAAIIAAVAVVAALAAGCSPDQAGRIAQPPVSDPVALTLSDQTPQVTVPAGRDAIVTCQGTLHPRDGHWVAVWGDKARNLIVRGCHVTADAPGETIEGRRCLRVTGGTGTTWIGDLDCDGPHLSEGVNFSGPGELNVETVHIAALTANDLAGFSDNHPDALQTWGTQCGPVYVDNLEATTTFQGIYLGSWPCVPDVSLRNVTLRSAPPGARQLLILGPFLPAAQTPRRRVTLTNVTLEQSGARSNLFWPDESFWPGANITQP